ncbi:dynamin family protein [Cupriavidus laharis]|uniref:dynamin family protein n=1 Tax=Cupriavidus laharis TaxID=151654 RepID=UPI001CC50175|nr:dynamin family protein [Cupriavidus laharis]
MNQQLDSLRTRIDGAVHALHPWHTQFPDEIDAFAELLKDLESRRHKLSADARLSIGIMGQVKAGKSSFLNALLFQGKPVLPEAATPKTANLTKITWGPRPVLTVTFYTSEEWAQIEHAAASQGDGAEARVARELVAMAQANGIAIAATLKKGRHVVEADSIEDLIDRMNAYVGEDGQYTPLVQMTELTLPDDDLKGYEIVDTPGMNDPVPSRTDKTRQFMATCDVVMFLSRCSQFLDQSDMELLGRQLPTKGVRRMTLIAGQMDGAIIDDGFNRRSLAETERNIRNRLTARAEKEMGGIAARQNEELAAIYRGLQAPVFSSTYAHLFATWPEAAWRARGGMAAAYNAIEEIATDQWGTPPPSQDDWTRIANFAAIRDEYDAARRDKDALIDKARRNLVRDLQKRLDDCFAALRQAANEHTMDLESGDLEAARGQQQACEKAIANVASKLVGIFERTSDEARAACESMGKALRSEIRRYSKLDKRSGTETETRSRTISTSVWYKPWTWGDEKTVYDIVTHSYEYLATADAIERLGEFADNNTENLNAQFAAVVSTDKLRAELHKALLKSLDTSSKDFDPRLLQEVLPKALDKIKLPSLSFRLGDVRRSISSRFSSEARDDQMAALQEAVRESLADIAGRMLEEVNQKVDALCDALADTQRNLSATMTKALKLRLDRLEAALAEKEMEQQLVAKLIDTIEQLGDDRLGDAPTAKAA